MGCEVMFLAFRVLREDTRICNWRIVSWSTQEGQGFPACLLRGGIGASFETAKCLGIFLRGLSGQGGRPHSCINPSATVNQVRQGQDVRTQS